MDKVFVNINDLEWVSAKNYHKGTMRKSLRDDGDNKTILLKIPSGFEMGSHVHTVNEQHFILEGEYAIGSNIFKKGTYQLFPKGFTHGPFHSKNGAVILVIWDS